MPPNDEYGNSGEGNILSGSKRWATITPDDDADLAFIPKAISVGTTAGTVVCTGDDGVDATFYFNAGQEKPIRPTRIKATGTTATPIIGVK